MVGNKKIFICFAVFTASVIIHAQDVDLSRINPMERLKFFNSESKCWIPQALLVEPTYSYDCRRSVSAIGEIITRNQVQNIGDTFPTEVTSTKGKLGFGISYSISVCYANEPLSKSNNGWTVDPFALFTRHLYLLNSVRGSVFYVVNADWAIETGFEYGYAKLSNRKGLESVQIANVVDSIDGWLATATDWTLGKMSVFILVNKNSVLSYGAEITYSRASTQEGIWAPILVEEEDVSRHCIGGGILFVLKPLHNKNTGIGVLPCVGGRISFAYEYTNNSPWQSSWHERLNVSFSGVYVGLQLVW